MSETINDIAALLTGEDVEKENDDDDVNLDNPFRANNYKHNEVEPESEEASEEYEEAPQEREKASSPVAKSGPVNPQQLQQQYNELEQAVSQLNQMAQNNEISRQDYQIAMQNAQQMSMGLQQANLNMQEGALKHNQRVETYHKKVGEMIPEWNNPKKRENIQSNMSHWAQVKYGISEADVTQWGQQASPTQLKMYYDSYQADQPKPKSPPRRRNKRKGKKVDTSYRQGTEQQTSAIADLLINLGI